VLEPLSGYLTLGAALAESATLHGEPFNFGPKAEQNGTVIDLLRKLSAYWKHNSEADALRIVESRPFHEAGLLKLNCDKALFHLKWEPTFEFDETIRLVSEWYRSYYRQEGDMYALTLDQIAFYEGIAAERGRSWTAQK
jgi:CDP-glucose 4,6-dehydratase